MLQHLVILKLVFLIAVSGNTFAVLCSLLIILPLILSYLTLNLWKFLKGIVLNIFSLKLILKKLMLRFSVRDRVFDQRYEPLLDLCSATRVCFMVKCAVLGTSLTVCLRELICNSPLTTIYETRIIDESETWVNIDFCLDSVILIDFIHLQILHPKWTLNFFACLGGFHRRRFCRKDVSL